MGDSFPHLCPRAASCLALPPPPYSPPGMGALALMLTQGGRGTLTTPDWVSRNGPAGWQGAKQMALQAAGPLGP